MTWAHSTSTDLIHWKNHGEVIQPDALGTIFSGSSVVDKENTAGFGRMLLLLFTLLQEQRKHKVLHIVRIMVRLLRSM